MRSESSCAYGLRNSRRSLKRRSMRKNGIAPTVIDEASVTDSLRTFLLEKQKSSERWQVRGPSCKMNCGEWRRSAKKRRHGSVRNGDVAAPLQFEMAT